MVLEDWDVFTMADFADFLDGIDGVEGACKRFANRIRSDELAVAVRATVTADAMSAACTSAELRLLGVELCAMEGGVAALSARAARGAQAAADALILDEELSTAKAELTSSRRAADTHKHALQSIKAELADVKLKLAAAVRARHEAEVAAAKALGLALLDAKAAQCAAETAQAAAEENLEDALAAQEALASRAEQRVALLEEQLSARTSRADVETQTSPPASPALPATVNNYRIRHRQSTTTSPCGVTFATAAPPHIQPPQPGAQAPVPHSLCQVPWSPPLAVPSPLPPRLNQPRWLRITYGPDSDDDE